MGPCHIHTAPCVCIQGVQRSLPVVPTERLLNATRSLLLCIQSTREQVLLKGVKSSSGLSPGTSPETNTILISQVRSELAQIMQVSLPGCPWNLVQRTLVKHS